KKTNSFILADEKKVKAICKGEKNGLTYSKEKFNIVVCKLKNKGGRKPNCQYRGNNLTNRVVVVKCEEHLPVHYEKDTPNFAE
ncbi:hypothetical protein, partial [Paraclostridium dentum]|uniref:hypothetical protein n=1 Tax=Paraclostridium dentum TaxID=2662455 RepID=UPI003F3AD1BB